MTAEEALQAAERQVARCATEFERFANKDARDARGLSLKLAIRYRNDLLSAEQLLEMEKSRFNFGGSR